MKDLSKYYTPIDENQYAIQYQKIYTEFYDDDINYRLTDTQRQIVEKTLDKYQVSSSVRIKWREPWEFSRSNTAGCRGGSISIWVGYSLDCDEIIYVIGEIIYVIGEDDWFWVYFKSIKDTSKHYKCDGFGGFIVFLKNHLDMVVNRM